jgi:hypothetical protein
MFLKQGNMENIVGSNVRKTMQVYMQVVLSYQGFQMACISR